jgi:hypothetical protein
VASTGPSASCSSSDEPARADSSSRTASQATFTAPPVIIVCREADEDPAVPTLVSAGSTTTRSTPSSVRAICSCTVTRPWPTSAAAVWTSTSGSPPAIEIRTRAVE